MSQQKVQFRNRKLKIGKLLIPLILVVVLASVGTAFAVAYVVLQWTTSATVVANPKVCFVNWTDGSKANTFNYAVNIFPSITTIDENITYGVWDWVTTTGHTAYFSWSSLTTSTNIASLNVTIYNSTATIYTHEWTSVPSFPTAWESFTTAANTKYTIYLKITATSGATGSSTFTFELKVENP